MAKCLCCGSYQLFTPLSHDQLCRSCGTYKNRVAICKSIISGSDPKYQKYIDGLRSNKERGAEIIALLRDYDTTTALHCKTMGYLMLGASHRRDQIECAERLVKTNELDKRDMVYVLNLLANAYEGEYMFDEAIGAYQHLLSISEDHTSAHIKIANIMVKQDRITEAIEYLEKLYITKKANPSYYKDVLTGKKKLRPEYESDMRCIPIHIKELERKIERGYKYKPRKKTIKKP